MPFRPGDFPPPPGCRLLRPANALGSDPRRPAGSGPEAFWCVATTRNVGPDGMLVHPDACDESRSCFQPPAVAPEDR
jgi:hypothetical protein